MILAMFSVIVFVLSFNIPVFTALGATPISSAFIPRLWTVSLMALSTRLILRGLKCRRIQKIDRKETGVIKIDGMAFFKKNYGVILTFLMLGIYIALIGIIGFIIMSVFYVFVQILILTPPGKRNLLLAGIIAVMAAVIVDYLFVSLLHILLPKGLLGF
jgi:hypothetical protein